MDIFKQLSSGADVDMPQQPSAQAPAMRLPKLQLFFSVNMPNSLQVPTCSLMEVLLRAYVQENIN